jgi:hypothetical protein
MSIAILKGLKYATYARWTSLLGASWMLEWDNPGREPALIPMQQEPGGALVRDWTRNIILLHELLAMGTPGVFPEGTRVLIQFEIPRRKI